MSADTGRVICSLQPENTVESILDREIASSVDTMWTKLSKTTKVEKLISFAAGFTENNALDDELGMVLEQTLLRNLDMSRLSRMKDVVYDPENKVILDVPGLELVPGTRHFTLKRNSRTKTKPKRKN